SSIAQVSFVIQPLLVSVYHMVLGPLPTIGGAALENGPATPSGPKKVSGGWVECTTTVKLSGSTTPRPGKATNTETLNGSITTSGRLVPISVLGCNKPLGSGEHRGRKACTQGYNSFGMRGFSALAVEPWIDRISRIGVLVGLAVPAIAIALQGDQESSA